MAVEFEMSKVVDACLRRSTLAVGVAPFVLSLTSSGYTHATIRGYVGAIAHLACWMTQEHIALDQLDEQLMSRFVFEHIPQCQCLSPASRVVSNLRAAALRFIAVGRRAGLIPPAIEALAPSLAAELDAFNAYLEGSRGLAATTRAPRRRIVADFLMWRFRDDAPDPARLRVGDVHGFLLERLEACAPGKAAVISGALRSYLRFRALQGQAVEALLAAVPAVAQWPLDRLPQVLSDALIASVECTFDRSTAGGLRDYALFRLMLDLGLRVSEAVAIQLQDIDWRAGTLRVATRKTHRVDTLPLSQAVASAIIQYLHEARPVTTQRALFVRKTAPVEVPITLHAVRAVMRQAYARCGHAELAAKTHVLRHTAASRLLRAGTPLKQIADVLRHRCLNTTTIYAKVDAVRLAAVAMPWPGSGS